MHLNRYGFQRPTYTPLPTPGYTPAVIIPEPSTPVPQGCPLAYLGNTGTSNPHLHFEIRDQSTFTPTATQTMSPTSTYSPTVTPTQEPGSPTWTAAPTSSPTPTNSPTPVPTVPSGTALPYDYMNVFDYLTVDNTQSCRTILESALVIPETGSKLEPISPLDAVKYAPGLPGCLLLNLNGTTPLRFRLIGRCKFVIRAYDRITPDGNKLGLYWIGYRKEGDPLLNYELEFDKVLYDERRDRLGDIYRLDQKFGTTLNPTQYWYKMYYERTATPTPFNLKSHIDYGVFDSAMYEVGPEIRLLLEAQQYPYTGSPPLPVRQRLLVVHVDSDVSWVDCDEGSDDNPGT
ncbi:MAG TPA: hypothetical protein PKH07_17710, partial [bacterium]|nr:hypothetical protein [bacterium]